MAVSSPPYNGLPRSDSDNTLVDNIVERSAVAWKEPLLTLDEAVELHQHHVLGVNNEETPGIADVPETAPIQSAAVNSKPKVVATIRIEYPAEDCSDWSSHTFFSPSFPEELEALLLDSVFQSRMLSINQELGQFSQWGLVDLIPIVRTLMTIIFFVVTGVVLSGSLTTGLATWFITLAIMFLMMIATYAFKPPAEALLSKKMAQFSKEDNLLHIKWTLLPLRTEMNAPMIAADWRLKKLRTDFRIQVAFTQTLDDNAGLLPEYTPRFSSTSFLRCDDTLVSEPTLSQNADVSVINEAEVYADHVSISISEASVVSSLSECGISMPTSSKPSLSSYNSFLIA